ncbi:MAG: hypothetical protein L6R28_23400 [Planctomycetes bacterium]|nr:hypothetical protein [Planctomycetota bacterium]
MKLEWFREHQSKFFLITAILVIPGLMVFGPSMFDEHQGGGIPPNNSVTVYALDFHPVNYSGDEVYEKRRQMTYFTGYGGTGENNVYSTLDVARHLERLQIVRDLGVRVGNKELQELVREDIRRRVGESGTVITDKIYNSVLQELSITKNEYEALSREVAELEVFRSFLNQGKLPDSALYIRYLREKHGVRLRWRAFESKDFEKDVAEPTAEEILKYFDDKKALESTEPDALYGDERLSADLLKIPPAEVKKNFTADEAALKEFYDTKKGMYWKVLDQAPPKEGEEPKSAFKPYDEVKEEVAKQYWEHNKSRLMAEQFQKFEKELAEEQAKLDKENKKVDLEAFAKARGFTYWRTEKLTYNEFLEGKAGISTPNFSDLFTTARKAADPETEKERAEQRAKFRNPVVVDVLQDTEAYLAMRQADYAEKTKLTLEEATPVIKRRLIETAAAAKAEAEAKKLYDAWSKGENLPKDEELTEGFFSSANPEPKNKNALARQYFADPKALGEVLPVASDKDLGEGEQKDAKSRRMRYFVGFPVERFTPSFNAFKTDNTWNREQKRQAALEGNPQFAQYIGARAFGQSSLLMLDALNFLTEGSRKYQINGSLKDPPIGGRGR